MKTERHETSKAPATETTTTKANVPELDSYKKAKLWSISTSDFTLDLTYFKPSILKLTNSLRRKKSASKFWGEFILNEVYSKFSCARTYGWLEAPPVTRGSEHWSNLFFFPF